MFNFSVNKTLEQKPTKDSRRFMVASKACHVNENLNSDWFIVCLGRRHVRQQRFTSLISVFRYNWRQIEYFTYINACKCITTNLVIITVFLERRRFNNNGLVTITQDIT